jgi:hypothetical protein
MDGGAKNGGMPGSDIRIISASDFHKAYVTDIGESSITDLPLVTAAVFLSYPLGSSHHPPSPVCTLCKGSHNSLFFSIAYFWQSDS